MKKIRRLAIALLLVLCLCVNSMLSSNITHVVAASDDGLIYGADIGYLSQLENLGVTWVDDNGVEKDALALLKEKGVNAVRLLIHRSCSYWIVL